jgi:hypothetical protein
MRVNSDELGAIHAPCHVMSVQRPGSVHVLGEKVPFGLRLWSQPHGTTHKALLVNTSEGGRAVNSVAITKNLEY